MGATTTGTSDTEQHEQRRRYQCTSSHPFGLEMHVWNRVWIPPTHLLGVYGIYLILSGGVPWTVVIPTGIYGYFMGLGITVGCHRYWSHRTFKAKLPLQIFLAVAQTAAGQHSIWKWCKDHRLHHKFTETPADPYNAQRGFWFAHMGWLMVREDPAVKEKEATLDLSDLDNDPIVRFQSKHYRSLELLAVFILPICGLLWLFPELTFSAALAINCFRYIIVLHFTWLVNSAAHLYGYRPYDTGIFARENKLVALLAIGEGWHNYHHTFPWDYKTAELGFYGLNWSALFIDCCAWMGLAYDLKSVPHDVVMARVKRTGDMKVHEGHGGFSHHHDHNHDHNHSSDGGGSQAKKNDKEGKGTMKKTPSSIPQPPPSSWRWGDEDCLPQEHQNIAQTLKVVHA